MEDSMPEHLGRVLKELRSQGEVACLVVDLLASAAIRVAEQVGVRVAGFWPAMFATYRVLSAIPVLIRQGIISDCGTPLHQYNQQFIKPEEDDNDNYEDEKVSNVLLPTKPKLSSKDFPWLVGNPSSQRSRFKFWLRTMGRANTLPYLLINSFPQEDGQPRELSDHGPTVLPVGPLLSSTDNPTMWEEDKSCMNWLDEQRPASVIYVSFGSWVGPIEPEKMAELALGLEATKQP
ncbi:UDP-glycosyltransferase 82A1-like, partial [Asparagus officinalis]